MQRVRKDDMVAIIAGKDKGKRGKVKSVNHRLGRVVVEGLTMVKRHTKPSQKNTQGGIITQEGTVHISNVMPIDPSTDRPTRVHRITDGQGSRRAAKSGAIIEVTR